MDAEPGPIKEAYEPPYIKINIPEMGVFNDFEMVMLQACMFIIEQTPMYPCSRPLTPLEKERIVKYLAARYSASERE